MTPGDCATWTQAAAAIIALAVPVGDLTAEVRRRDSTCRN